MGDGYGNRGRPGGPRPKGFIHDYVPMPEPPGTYPRIQGRSKRDILIRNYGEVSVMHAEVAVCVNIMIQLNLLKKSEFVELVERALAVADIARQRHAESGGKEG